MSASMKTSTVVLTTTTWLRKAVWYLRQDGEEARNADARWLVSQNAADFMQDALSELETLVPLLERDEEFPDVYDEIEKSAAVLARRLKHQRLALKLAEVEGRTPEESALFAAKARRLGH